MGRTSAAAKNRYSNKAYDRIGILVRKGRKERIRSYAESKGMSLNGYINALIDADMGDNSGKWGVEPVDIEDDNMQKTASED